MNKVMSTLEIRDGNIAAKRGNVQVDQLDVEGDPHAVIPLPLDFTGDVVLTLDGEGRAFRFENGTCANPGMLHIVATRYAVNAVLEIVPTFSGEIGIGICDGAKPELLRFANAA